MMRNSFIRITEYLPARFIKLMFGVSGLLNMTMFLQPKTTNLGSSNIHHSFMINSKQRGTNYFYEASTVTVFTFQEKSHLLLLLLYISGVLLPTLVHEIICGIIRIKDGNFHFTHTKSDFIYGFVTWQSHHLSSIKSLLYPYILS